METKKTSDVPTISFHSGFRMEGMDKKYRQMSVRHVTLVSWSVVMAFVLHLDINFIFIQAFQGFFLSSFIRWKEKKMLHPFIMVNRLISCSH